VPLALKLHASEQLLTLGQPMTVLCLDADAAAVLTSFENLTDSACPVTRHSTIAPGDAQSEPPLDRQFARVASRLETDNRRPDLSVLGTRSLDLLAKVAHAGVCVSCAASSPKPNPHTCRWQPTTERADARTLRERGRCLLPARQVYEFCTQLATREYQAALKVESSIRLSWATGFTNESDPHLEIALAGATLEDPASGGERTVRVAFHVHEFSFTDYLTLPYLVAHECLVHGYCGVELEHEDADWSKPFHDGWMDLVAYSILQKELKHCSLTGSSHPVARYHSEFSRQAHCLREKRYDESGQSAPPDVIVWRAGAQALETFTCVVGRALWSLDRCSLDDSQRIEQQVNLISLAINASSISHEHRGQLVDAINVRLSRNNDVDRLAALSEWSESVQAVAAYLLGPRDIHKLMYRLLDL